MNSITITFPSFLTFSDLESKLNSTSKKLGLKNKIKDNFSIVGGSIEGADQEYENTEILIKKFGIPILRTGIYDRFSNCPSVSQLKLYYNPTFGIEKLAKHYAQEFSKE